MPLRHNLWCDRCARRRSYRRLPHRGGRRPRRHGHRLPRDPAVARPARRAQADRPRARRRRRASASASSASRGGRGDRPPERHPGLRGGRGGRPPLPRHALRGGDRPAPRCWRRERPARRPARGARSSPRSARALDAAHAAGLVHRDVKPPTSCSAASTPTSPTSGSPADRRTDTRLTTDRALDRHRRLHGARAVPGRRDRRARGRLRARLRALRRADRRAAVPARDGAGDDARPPARRAAAAVRVAPGVARGLRPRDRARAGQGARGPLPVGRATSAARRSPPPRAGR